VTDFVLDCSVAMAWCFEDEADGYADHVLGALLDGSAFVPVIWPLEVANVVVVAERRGRLTPAEGREYLALLRRLPVRVDQESAHRAFEKTIALARARRLSTYDAAYLELAIRGGIPLATADAALRRAATRAGVELFVP
jgi:predicted nucleic acid-binding protein